MLVENLLQELGMTERESKIYIAGLELGMAKNADITKRVKDNRITVYSAIKTLCDKNFCIETVKNKKRYYTMVDPEELLVREETKCEKLKKAVPQLISFRNDSPDAKPKVMYFEGVDGVKKIFEMMLKTKVEKRSFYSIKNINKEIEFYFKNEFSPRKEELGIKTRMMTPKTSHKESENTKIKILGKNQITFDGQDLSLFGGDSIALCKYGEGEVLGVVIKEPSLYKVLGNLFELVWNNN